MIGKREEYSKQRISIPEKTTNGFLGSRFNRQCVKEGRSKIETTSARCLSTDGSPISTMVISVIVGVIVAMIVAMIVGVMSVVAVIIMTPAVVGVIVVVTVVVGVDRPHLEVLVLLLHESPESGFGRAGDSLAVSNSINHLLVIRWPVKGLIAGEGCEILEEEIWSREILDLEDMEFVKVLNSCRATCMEVLKGQTLELIVDVQVEMLAEEMAVKTVENVQFASIAGFVVATAENIVLEAGVGVKRKCCYSRNTTFLFGDTEINKPSNFVIQFRDRAVGLWPLPRTSRIELDQAVIIFFGLLAFSLTAFKFNQGFIKLVGNHDSWGLFSLSWLRGCFSPSGAFANHQNNMVNLVIRELVDCRVLLVRTDALVGLWDALVNGMPICGLGFVCRSEGLVGWHEPVSIGCPILGDKLLAWDEGGHHMWLRRIAIIWRELLVGRAGYRHWSHVWTLEVHWVRAVLGG